MWLQPLRQQILRDFADHATPAGCVATYQTARRLSHPERQDIPAGNDAQRDAETEPS